MPDTPPITPDQKDVEEHKVVAALSYLGILCLVPLLGSKQSKFAQFHAKQGLVLFVIDVLVSFIARIPFIGWISALTVLVASVYGVLRALAGKYWEIPYVGKYAKEINL